MTRNPKLMWPALAAIFLVQASTLGWMIWDRVTLLKTGREITLDVIPLDPRSLFRGDYVILSYLISRVPTNLLQGSAPERNAPVYVRLAKDGEVWRAAAVTAAYPDNVPAGEIVLKAKQRYHSWPVSNGRTGQTMLTYGIESYFVPEGKGRALEKLVREKKLSAVIAVGKDGVAAIKGLSTDGKTVYDEPLF
jgi:uncharacterized membrane-anchored protein